MDTELDAWRHRPLTRTTYPYLSLDARYEHVRQGGRIVSQGVLVAAGVRADRHREILAVTVADTDSTATYHELFRDLKARGLSGVRRVTSDNHAGLKAAIDRHFQGASWQRCQVHFARDLVGMVGVGRRGDLAADPREILATTCAQELTTVAAVAGRWEPSHPAVARLLDDGIEDGLACLAFPLAHRTRIRTTNGLERLHEGSSDARGSSRAPSGQIPEPGGVLATGLGDVRGAVGGMGQRAEVSRHGRTVPVVTRDRGRADVTAPRTSVIHALYRRGRLSALPSPP